MTGIARPSRNCAHPGCVVAVTSGSRCIEHARPAWAGSQTATDKAKHRQRYGKGWAQRREFVLRRANYMCVACDRPHQLQVHHLDDTGNVNACVTLCVSCHRRAEHEDRQGTNGPVTRAILAHLSGGAG